VRNTFLDVDDASPGPKALQRASSTPPGYPAAQGRGPGEAPGDADWLGQAGATWRHVHHAPLTLLAPPPGAMNTTRDKMESGEAWSWANRPIAQASVPDGAAGGQQRPGLPFGGGAEAYTDAQAVAPPMAPYTGQAAPMYPAMMQVAAAGPDGGAAAMFVQPQPSRPVGWTERQQRDLPPDLSAPPLAEAPARAPGDHAQLAGIRFVADAGDASPLAPPQPQTLQRECSEKSKRFRVYWTVDARKLRGNDKQAVSPPFDLKFGEQSTTFKMMIYPKVVNDGKGGASFKKSGGRGFVQLKCEAELAGDPSHVNFRISIGTGDKQQGFRGPVSHNFSSSAVCGLPKDQDEWDFNSARDDASSTFVVCLEIVPYLR